MRCRARVDDSAVSRDGGSELAHVRGRERELDLRIFFSRTRDRGRLLRVHAVVSLAWSLTLLAASWPPAIRLEVPGLATVVTGRVRPCFIAPFERALPRACRCAQRGVIALLLRRSAACQLSVLVLLGY